MQRHGTQELGLERTVQRKNALERWRELRAREGLEAREEGGGGEEGKGGGEGSFGTALTFWMNLDCRSRSLCMYI
jgi:hypothetical protein